MSQPNMTDGGATATTSFSHSNNFSREQVASPYDNSNVSDYINALTQHSAPASAPVQESGDDVFPERHFHEENDDENGASLFSNSMSRRAEPVPSPGSNDHVASHYRLTLQDIAATQIMNRSLLESGLQMRLPPQHQDDCHTPAELSPTMHDRQSTPQSVTKMYDWKKPPQAQNAPEPPRFHRSEPVSAVVENLLERDTAKKSVAGIGTRGEAFRDKSRSYDIARQPVSISQAGPTSLQGMTNNGSSHDNQQQQRLNPNYKENVRKIYPLDLADNVISHRRALQGELFPNHDRGSNKSGHAVNPSSLLTSTDTYNTTAICNTDIANNNTPKHKHIPIDSQLLENSASITSGDILPLQHSEVSPNFNTSEPDFNSNNRFHPDIESRLLVALEEERHNTHNRRASGRTMSPAKQSSDNEPPAARAPGSRKRANSKLDPAKPTKRAKAQTKDIPTTAPKKRGGKKNADDGESIPPIPKAPPKTAARKNAKVKTEIQQEDEDNLPQAEEKNRNRATSFSDMSTARPAAQDSAPSMNLPVPGQQRAIELPAEGDNPISARRAHHRDSSNGSVGAIGNAASDMSESLHREMAHAPTIVPVAHGHSRTLSYGATSGPQYSSISFPSNTSFISPYNLAAQYNPEVQMYRQQSASSPQTTSPSQHAFNGGQYPGRSSMLYKSPADIAQPQLSLGHQRASSAGMSGLVNIDQTQVRHSMHCTNQYDPRHIASASLSPALIGRDTSGTMQGGEGQNAQDVAVQLSSQSVDIRQVTPSNAQLSRNMQCFQQNDQSAGVVRYPSQQSLSDAENLRRAGPMFIPAGLPASGSGWDIPQTSNPAQYPSQIDMQDILFEPFPSRNLVTTYGRRELPSWYLRPLYTDRTNRNLAGLPWPLYYRTIAIENGHALYTFTDDELDHLRDTAALDASGRYDWSLVTDDLIAENQAAARAATTTATPSAHVDTSRDSSAMMDAASNLSQENDVSTLSSLAFQSREGSAINIPEKDEEK